MKDKYPKITYVHYRVEDVNNESKLGQPIEMRGKPKSFILYERKCKHHRKPKIYPHGGKTVCKIDFGNGRYSIGEAVCSMSDNFSYKTGRILALARAMELLDPVTKTAVGSVL